MVVFTCETCFAVLKKQQIDKHCTGKCSNAWHFTCVECGKTFEGYEYKDHNECMTEVQKYQGEFLAKKRQEKADRKKKVTPEEYKKSAENSEKKNSDSESEKSEKPKKKKKNKHLDDDNSFLGWRKTAKSIL